VLGLAVPIPTLPPEIEIGELVTVAVPLNTGTVPEEVVPEVVTVVCAAAPAAISANVSHARFTRFVIVSIPSLRVMGFMPQDLP
jgi:hypothetical protein